MGDSTKIVDCVELSKLDPTLNPTLNNDYVDDELEDVFRLANHCKLPL